MRKYFHIQKDKLYLFDNINIDDEYLRNYVFPNEFSHLIGYVSRPNDSDIKKLSAKKIPKDVYLNDNFKIGHHYYDIFLIWGYFHCNNFIIYIFITYILD